jgi:cation:H+ antiporter
MQTIVLFSFAIITGLILLTWSAGRFVTGSSALALSFNVSPLTIGLTIVAFGTSAPEMLVSAMAAWQGNSGIAIGNVIGSNIVNMTLVLGMAALITPLTISSQTLNREFPLTLVVMLFALALIYDGLLSRLDGILLMAGMILVILWTLHLAHSAPAQDPLTSSFSEEMPEVNSKHYTWWLVISGLVVLLISSRLLVWGAVGIAQSLGITDLVIGLTIVAVGTSLPELAASVVAAMKGEHDIAVGNVVGSSLFNILAVLGIAGIVGPGSFDSIVLNRDYPLMIVLAVILYLMARGLRSSGYGSIQRWAGGTLLTVFIIYQAWLFHSGLA